MFFICLLIVDLLRYKFSIVYVGLCCVCVCAYACTCVRWLWVYCIMNSALSSVLLLIRGRSLAISNASLIRRLPRFLSLASILTVMLLSMLLHLIKCLRNVDACVCKCSLILMCSGLVVLPM